MPIEDYYLPAELWRETETGTVDDQGRAIKAWAKHSDIECAINQATSQEIMLADKQDLKVTHHMYCATTVPITNDDQIKQGGEVYRVISKPKNTLQRGHHLKVLLEWVGADNG